MRYRWNTQVALAYTSDELCHNKNKATVAAKTHGLF